MDSPLMDGDIPQYSVLVCISRVPELILNQ